MENPPFQHNPIDPAMPQRPQHPLANYQFSVEELRVLRECNTESFFQRSLPIGTLFGLGAYFGIKQGYLQASAKFGTIPKVAVGVIFGYFLGKFSYQQKCVEKIMKLPNSKLAEVLRQQRGGAGGFGVLPPDSGLSMSPFSPSSNADVYTDEQLKPRQSSALDLDTERQQNQGLDDTFRPSLDNTPQTFEELAIEPPKQTVTYDELRRKNRDEYAKKAASVYSRPIAPEVPVVRRVIEKPEEDSFAQAQSNGPRNKYGDAWSQ